MQQSQLTDICFWWNKEQYLVQVVQSGTKPGERTAHAQRHELWWLLQACMLSCFSHVWLCDPMDCSPPGSSVPGILQATTLEWVAIPSSRRSSWPRDQTNVSGTSCIGRQVLFLFLPLAPPGKPDGFWGRVFKDKVRERVTAWSVCEWFSDWLMVRSQSHNYQFSGTSWSGGCVLMVIMQLASFTWWGF